MRTKYPRITGYLLSIVMPILATGCGTSNVEVTGRVSFKGKAMENGSVTFFCKNKQIASGLIRAGGEYRISDVPPGPVLVAVRSHPRVPEGFALKHRLPPSRDAPLPELPKAGTTDAPYVPVPERFNHPEESGLSFVVSANKTMFNIDLKP